MNRPVRALVLVLLLAPGMAAAQPLAQRYADLVFYFHSWRNNVDDTFAKFRVAEQFATRRDRESAARVDYTAEGGTREQTMDFMEDLRAWNIPFVAVPESAVTEDLLRKNRLVFIESALEHDDVVARKEQFRNFLTASALPRR